MILQRAVHGDKVTQSAFVSIREGGKKKGKKSRRKTVLANEN